MEKDYLESLTAHELVNHQKGPVKERVSNCCKSDNQTNSKKDTSLKAVDYVSLPTEKQSYSEKETACEMLFQKAGPFWHLCTPGQLTQILFTNEDEFRFAMNLTGICADKVPQVQVYTFELMHNHIHMIMSGEKRYCQEMFDFFVKRLKRFFGKSERCVDLSKFQPQIIPIDNIKSLRNEIAYVNRNGFLVDPSYTPFSYPWGAGDLYFSSKYIMLKTLGATSYNLLNIREKRNICRSKDITLSNRIMVLDNMILPSSFCSIETGECFFRDGHHYFSMLSKSYEAYSEVAKRLCETIIINDEEMYSVVCFFSNKLCGVKTPNLLSATSKIEIAKLMHFEYNASNKQIQRILKLDIGTVETLFPISK